MDIEKVRERCMFEKQCDPQLSIKTYSNGSKHFVYQCKKCGCPLGNPIPKATIKNPQNASLYDDHLQNSYMEEFLKPLVEKNQLRRKQWEIISDMKNQAFKAKYGVPFKSYVDFALAHETYMQSETWKLVRARILKRDNYTCVFCGNRAIQVHHTTYNNMGFETDFELVSVCLPCHQSLHEIVELPFAKPEDL